VFHIYKHNDTVYRIVISNGKFIECLEWCQDNILKDEWYFRSCNEDFSTVYINGVENIMAFKLRWL